MKKQLKKVTKQDEDTTIFDEVYSGLKEEGVTFFEDMDIDSQYLVLPRYIDEEHINDISRRLNVFTQQRIYIRGLLTKYRILLKDVEMELAKHKDRIYSSLPAKMSVTEKEIKLLVDPLAADTLKMYNVVEEKYQTLGDNLRSLEEGIFLLSREITKRGIDLNSINRVENISKRRD